MPIGPSTGGPPIDAGTPLPCDPGTSNEEETITLSEEGPSTEEIPSVEVDSPELSTLEDVPMVTVTLSTTDLSAPSSSSAHTSGTANRGIQPSNHKDLTDYELLTAVTGARPLSTRLHLIRDRWIQQIMDDVKQLESEAERYISLSRKAPVGSRTWRLLREEADRIETQCTLTRGQLTTMRRAPGPYIQTVDTGNEDGDGSLRAVTH